MEKVVEEGMKKALEAKRRCPICGFLLARIVYRGKDPKKLATLKRSDFLGFLGCIRTELHDVTVKGVNYHGKIFLHPVFCCEKCAKKREKKAFKT